MNYGSIRRFLGMVLRFEAAFLLLPSIVALIYMEKAGLYYLLTAVLCFGIGTLLQLVRSDKGAFYTKEGFVAALPRPAPVS